MGSGSARSVAVALGCAVLACAGSNAKTSGASSPNCAPDGADAVGGRPESIAVLANDSAPDGRRLSLAAVSAPAHGTATVDPGGVVSYTAALGYTGPDAFTYRAADGLGGGCTGTVTIVVHAIANTTLHPISRGYPLDPVATADDAGGMWVVWPEVLPGGIELRALRTDAAMTTIPASLDGVLVSTISGPTGLGYTVPGVRAVSDGVGGIVVAWIDHLKTPPDHALFAQRIEISGAARWSPGGRPVCGQQDRNPTYDAGNHFDLLGDGAGGAFVAWVAGTDPDTTIAVQHLAGNDGMLDLGICGTTVTGSQTGATEPHLVADGADGVVVAWTRFGAGPSAQRLGPGGALVWGAEPVRLASAGFNASVAPDGTGGALMAFAFGPDYGDLRVQRVGIAGDLPWGSEGVDLVTTAGIQEFPRIAPDGAGGAVVAWWDHRGHAYSLQDAPATYAQRVHANGTVAWAKDGVLLCGSPVPRTDPGPLLVTDGAGGAIAVWMDQRDGMADANLFAQRLLAADGAAAWTANGIHVTDAPGAQTVPAILPDGAGGAAIFFKDGRNAAVPRISGQRLLQDGSLP